MHVVIFEDSLWHAFAPFSLSRPAFCLASGMSTLLARMLRHLKPTRLTLWVRPEMQSYCQQRVAPETGVPTAINQPLDDQPALLVHGRTIFSGKFDIPCQESAAVAHETVIGAWVAAPGLAHDDALRNSDRWLALRNRPPMAWPGHVVPSPVDLIYGNDKAIADDFQHIADASVPIAAGPYHLVSVADIWLGNDVQLAAGCVVDASKGPVVISDGASIGPNAVVQGPCFIGPGPTISPLAMIRPGNTIGGQCKVGGEVSMSIILGCSNKAHEGFLGHSYIGRWVNLGAGTTTSNLKNTYGEITLQRGKTQVATGRRFLGALIGDHAKTAILTRLMGGSYVGFSSMVASSGHCPRFIPSFTFLTDRGSQKYEMDKAIEVAQRMFTRRDRAWTETDEQIMNYVAATAPGVEA